MQRSSGTIQADPMLAFRPFVWVLAQEQPVGLCGPRPLPISTVMEPGADSSPSCPR